MTFRPGRVMNGMLRKGLLNRQGTPPGKDRTMKTYTILYTYHGRTTKVTDTLPNLIEHFSYTLECGKAYEWERGNKRINTAPKTARSLVTNLNNAESNRARNGCASTSYELI